jgi:hypothetical protein
MKNRLAACSCGQLNATVTADPVRASICHCLACQRRTGSAFGFQARFREEDVQQSGRSSEFVRTGDSGKTLTYQFCPDCGATLSYTISGLDGTVIIPVGAFADPDFPAPVASVYERRKHRWIGLPEDMTHTD